MFDVAFSEILVIAVVALIVIGPEKLPKVARTLGHLTGKFQRYIGNVKSEIEREIQFEELQKLQNELKVRAETRVADVQKRMQDESQAIADELSSAIDGTVDNQTHSSGGSDGLLNKNADSGMASQSESIVSDSPSTEHPQLSLQLASQEATGKPSE